MLRCCNTSNALTVFHERQQWIHCHREMDSIGKIDEVPGNWLTGSAMYIKCIIEVTE